MTETTEARAARTPAALLRPLLPLLAAAFALAALWLGWAGWQQWQAEQREARLMESRDAARDAVAAAITSAQREFRGRLDAAPVRVAVAMEDLPAAAAHVSRGWKGVEKVELLPADLDAAYAALPAAGYGRLGAVEAALSTGEPQAVVAKVDGKPRLLLAQPVTAGQPAQGVALARLPLSRITAPVDAADLPEDSYLALRQGGHSVHARGDAALADGAEMLAVAVPGSGLRAAAGLPDAVGAPFGLGAMACLAAAGVLALLALASLLGLRRKRAAGDTAAGSVDADAPTFAETLRQAPPAPEPTPVLPVQETQAESGHGDRVLIQRGIFRAYDIRGIVGANLDIGVAELIGQAIGSLMAEKGHEDIVVGRDGRLSGPDMSTGLIDGLRRAGRNVIDIGLAATPVTYFAAYHLRAGSCVSVTGSHNPPDYNGFKIVVGGETLAGDAITALYDRIAEDRLHEAPVPGTVQHRDVSADYIRRIADDVQLDRPLKVVVDAGNGVAGAIAPQVLEAIGAEVTPLYCEVDGTFPHHHPDPSEAHNLEALIQMVQRLGADLGVAFDGDGDRLGVVTREGHNIFPDRLLMLFAADVLERNPGAVVVYDVKCTGRLPGQILRHGGSPLMWKTGHSLIKAKMRETEAELAGEMSGHFFFKERWYGFDDGIYAAARLLEILAARPQSPSEVLDALPDGVSTPELKVQAPDGNPHAFVERFRGAARFDGARLSTIDGLRVDWPDGWGLVRASNTTPVLVLRFDADSKDALVRIQEAFRSQLLALRPDLRLPF